MNNRSEYESKLRTTKDKLLLRKGVDGADVIELSGSTLDVES